MATPEIYATEQFRPGEWMCYEKHPVPGGVPMPLASAASKEEALSKGTAYLASRPDGTCFKAERSVVGA